MSKQKKNVIPEQTEPTEEQLKIKRNKISGRKFRSLKDEFSGKNFTDYIEKLEEFRAEYADTPIVTNVDEEIRAVKIDRETAANSWWISKRDQYLKSVNAKNYVNAYSILESFPKDFVKTEQAKIIDDRKNSIRENVILLQILFKTFNPYNLVVILGVILKALGILLTNFQAFFVLLNLSFFGAGFAFM